MRETAFLLCGGRGRRFGSDKRFIVVGGMPLFQFQLEKLKRCFQRTALLCKKGEEHLFCSGGAPVFAEEEQDSSMLCGIIAGLSRTGGESALFLSVDMPLVPLSAILFFRDYPAAPVPVIPLVENRLQPGFGIYPGDSLAELRACREQGIYRFSEILPRLGAMMLHERDLPFMAANRDCMLNINRPEDLARLREKYPNFETEEFGIC